MKYFSHHRSVGLKKSHIVSFYPESRHIIINATESDPDFKNKLEVAKKELIKAFFNDLYSNEEFFEDEKD